ncbi:protein ninD, partial [Salmonella enterica subsp. enterica serovar Infantis]|nr:protein ninD [Salmonella enterica]ECM0953968.1 protein ninD [Salmonella enterica subsp. enterica serovar Infantis]EHO3588322.1 protein ninD [Salmonella enterica]EJY7747585.1 protein ninD [Salmonella enterica subsp. enterica serovar Infantis]EKQ4114242.1 protein ninD [Salmonella enterica subsp. enterica serovar Infantis]
MVTTNRESCMKHCYRCGESKDDYRFRPNQ